MRISRLPVILTALGLLALVVAGLGTLVTLWSPSASASRGAPASEPACGPDDPCLAIVMDDVGRDLPSLHQLLALNLDLTYAVLPHAAYTAKSRAAIRHHGREILLHLPMAPQDPTQITDETVVLGRDGPLETAMNTCLELVPDAVGVNNHMGSAVSANPRLTTAILRRLRRRGLWFLDSRTVPGSLFCARARELGVSCVERDVFLDDPKHPTAQPRRLAEALKIARQRGRAVAIAHPLPATIELLQRLYRSEIAGRVRIRRLSRVVADGT